MLVRRTDAGLKYALSNTTVRVAAETSDVAAAHDAGHGLRPVASAMTSMSASSVRSTPSSVVSRSPAAARRMRSSLPGQRVQVEGVQRVAELQQHVVGDVHERADRPDAGGLQARSSSRRATTPASTSHDRGRVPRAELRVFDRDRHAGPTIPSARRQRHAGVGRLGRKPKRQVVDAWRSRARSPSTLRQSGRLAVTSKSMTASCRRRPQARSTGSIDATSKPRSASASAHLAPETP